MLELDDVECSVCKWTVDPLIFCVIKGEIICHRCSECRQI
jgi:hypothetical protein